MGYNVKLNKKDKLMKDTSMEVEPDLIIRSNTYWEPFSHDGNVYDLSHLHLFIFSEKIISKKDILLSFH